MDKLQRLWHTWRMSPEDLDRLPQDEYRRLCIDSTVAGMLLGVVLVIIYACLRWGVGSRP